MEFSTSDLGVEYTDSGPFRSYAAHAQGDNFAELERSLQVEEVDQDGGTLRSYHYEQGRTEVEQAAFTWLVQQYSKCTSGEPIAVDKQLRS